MLSNESLTQESAETGLPSESCQLLDSHVHNEGGLYDRMAADADNGSSDVAPKSINSLAELPLDLVQKVRSQEQKSAQPSQFPQLITDQRIRGQSLSIAAEQQL